MYQEPGNRNIPYKHSPQGVTDSKDTAKTTPGSMSSLQNLVPSLDTDNQWVGRPASAALANSIHLTNAGGINGLGQITAMIIFGRYAVGMAVSYNFPSQDEPFIYDLVTRQYVTLTGATRANTPISFLNLGLTTWYKGPIPITVTNPVAPSISMCGIGIKVIICHPGYNGNAGTAGTLLFGYIDFTVPSAPVYDCTNTTVNALPFQPQFVASFGQRAYYFMNPPDTIGGPPTILASDVLQPLIVTNAGYSLSFGDTIPLTGGAPLPLQNQLGGVAQSLIVFKGEENIYQVTGDFSLNNVFVNSLNVALGTLSPLSICSTPFGLAFLASDGFRMVSFEGTVTPPIGADGKGVVIPFVKSNSPVGIIAACNGTSLRVCGPDASGNQSDYYFEFSLQAWHGPHTFPATLGIGSYGPSYIFAPSGGASGIYSENILNVPGTSFTEGTATAADGSFEIVALPIANDTIVINGVTVTFIAGASSGLNVHINPADVPGTITNLVTQLNASANSSINVATYTDLSLSGLDLSGFKITYKTTGLAGNAFTMALGTLAASSANIMGGGHLTGGQSAVAESFIYTTTLLPLRDDIRECANVLSVLYGQEFDGNVWTCTLLDQAGSTIGGSPVTIQPRSTLSANQVPWTQPIVFDKLQYKVTGALTSTTRIGDYYMEYQTLGYVPIGFPY